MLSHRHPMIIDAPGPITHTHWTHHTHTTHTCATLMRENQRALTDPRSQSLLVGDDILKRRPPNTYVGCWTRLHRSAHQAATKALKAARLRTVTARMMSLSLSSLLGARRIDLTKACFPPCPRGPRR